MVRVVRILVDAPDGVEDEVEPKVRGPQIPRTDVGSRMRQKKAAGVRFM